MPFEAFTPPKKRPASRTTMTADGIFRTQLSREVPKGNWPADDEIDVLARDAKNVPIAIVKPRWALTIREEHRCVQCLHVFANHIWVATVFHRRVPVGGHTWCPCRLCPCHRSWAVPGDIGFDIRERIEDMTREEAVALGVPLRT